MALLLRPSMLDDLGLVPALTGRAARFPNVPACACAWPPRASPRILPDEHKTCIYRIVQESLHNCAQHAEAATVRVTVQQDGPMPSA